MEIHQLSQPGSCWHGLSSRNKNLSLKSGANCFDKHCNRKEKYFHSPGNIWPRKITAGNKSVVWVEERQDPRWENRSYSVIMSKPLRTGMVKQLTYLTRYLAAAISPDGKSIAAIENTIDNRNNLVILDGENGKLISSNPSPGNSLSSATCVVGIGRQDYTDCTCGRK